MKKASPDPELQRQQQAAQQEKVKTIQERLSSQTDQGLRYYGARKALSGASGASSPLASMFS